MSPEEVLLRQYAATRDADAFAAIVRAHSRLVYGTCLRVTGNRADAEEAAQDCFFALARHADRIQTSLVGWLHATARNAALAKAKRARRRRETEAAARSVAAARVEPTWQSVEPYVDTAIGELPDELRLPLILHYLDGQSQTEVATALGIGQSTVSRRLGRGVEELRGSLRKAGVAVSVAALASLMTTHAASAVAPAALAASLGKMAVAGVGGASAGTTASATAAAGTAGASATAGTAAATAATGGIGIMKLSLIGLAAATVVTVGIVGLNSGAQQPPPAATITPQAVPLAPQPLSAVPNYTVTVEGQVTDGATGKPVAEAHVRGWICTVDFRPGRAERSVHQEVKTDADGSYQLNLVSPLTTAGRYKGQDLVALTVRAAGYGTRPVFAKSRVTPENLTFRDLDVTLGAGRRLSGRIVDVQHQPVAGARLAVRDGMSGGWDDWGAWGSASSDEQGLFEIWLHRDKPNDMARNPWVTVIKQGYGTAVQWDILQKDDLADVVLTPGGTVKGRVIDKNGEQAAGCIVEAFLYPFGMVGRTVTDANGTWAMNGLPGKPSISAFFQRKNKRYIESIEKTAFYARMDTQSPLSQEPDCSIAVQEGKEIAAPDIVLREDATQEEKASRILVPASFFDKEKVDLMGRVEECFCNGARDVTARKSIAWSDVTKDEQGNRAITYEYIATIWDKDKYVCKDIFTFDKEGNLIGREKAEGYPSKVEPVTVDTSTQEGLVELVERFFTRNFRDIVSREAVEWGHREVKENGNVAIRYMYRATFRGQNKSLMNQVFTFNGKGEFVSVENVNGYPKDIEE